MKIFAIALAFVAALAAPALAADPYSPDAPESYDAPVYAFTGFGVGVDGGGQFGSAQVNGMGHSFDGIAHDGGRVGAHFEYLFAVDRFRFGADIEGGFSNANTTFDDFNILEQKSYVGTALKAGVTVYGSTLLYGRVGYEWSQWEAFEAIDADVGAWAFGGGIDTMVSEDWSLGIDARYMLVNDVDAAGEDLSDLFDDSEIIVAKARLTRRF
jgi:outer membrane immunogenic protein